MGQVSQLASAGYSLTASSTDTTSSLTRIETGNSITGAFSRTTTETDSTSLTDSGANATGTYTVNESTSESPTIHENGNSVTGDYTLTEAGTEGYTPLTNPARPPTGNWFSIHETGSSPTTLTQNRQHKHRRLRSQKRSTAATITR